MTLYSITYLSENPDYVLRTTGLEVDELEQLVGRFAKHSTRAGKLRGELRESGEVLEIWRNFPRKRVWSNE